MKKKFLILAGILFLAQISCTQQKNKKAENQKVVSQLQQIKNRGTLKAVVDYNSTNYFVYRGKPMGFKYELLQELCKDLDVSLEITVDNNIEQSFEGLIEGRFDIVAKNLTITKQRSEKVDFTFPLEQTRQVLVQRIKAGTNDSVYISSTLDLHGKTIQVEKNSSYSTRLQNLAEETGTNIVVEEDSVSVAEQLVAKVARGEINYTICDNNVAVLNKLYYPNLDVSLPISFPQNIAWAVRKGEEEWKSFLDDWIINFISTRKYRQLYYKYFESPRSVVRRKSDFNSLEGGKISLYDKRIKQLSEMHNWDWRLIAAIMYHESRFNPSANSWAGAYGLMQLMPGTAQRFGIENYKNTNENIKGGILLLNWLNKQFVESVPDSTERIKFVLASYNIGLGHVKDAQRLAKKYGKAENIWTDNVDFYLRNKSSETYYKDPVVRFGYCKGEEAYNHVTRVLGTYEHYLNVIDK